jgi:hypothetical protein
MTGLAQMLVLTWGCWDDSSACELVDGAGKRGAARVPNVTRPKTKNLSRCQCIRNCCRGRRQVSGGVFGAGARTLLQEG